MVEPPASGPPPVTEHDGAHLSPAEALEVGRTAMREALRASASALRAAEVPFALAGSYALWVFGGPEGDHDVDLVVPEGSVEDAVRALDRAGFEVDRPPEDWLFKAWHGGVLVDILHRLNGTPVEVDLVQAAGQHDVLGVRMPVLDPTVVITTKVLSLTEQYCDFGNLLPGARAVREQIAWSRVREAAVDHPYAEAFLFLADRLDIASDR